MKNRSGLIDYSDIDYVDVVDDKMTKDEFLSVLKGKDAYIYFLEKELDKLEKQPAKSYSIWDNELGGIYK